MLIVAACGFAWHVEWFCVGSICRGSIWDTHEVASEHGPAGVSSLRAAGSAVPPPAVPLLASSARGCPSSAVQIQNQTGCPRTGCSTRLGRVCPARSREDKRSTPERACALKFLRGCPAPNRIAQPESRRSNSNIYNRLSLSTGVSSIWKLLKRL